MRGSRLATLLGTVVAAAALASCGDVPTLDNGIAYITFTPPSPAVGVGDVLRDSLGNPAPLQVRAFDGSGVEVPVSGVTWISTPVPVGNGVTIDANGLVTAGDTTATVQIVGRIGNRLQTSQATLFVVAQPDSIAAANAPDTAITAPLPALDTMRVMITGMYKGQRVPVSSIRVRYHIEALYPASSTGYRVLTNRGGTIPRPDSTTVIDTTGSNGTAGVASAILVAAGSDVDSVAVSVRAFRFNGRPLAGSPVRFVLKRK